MPLATPLFLALLASSIGANAAAFRVLPLPRDADDRYDQLILTHARRHGLSARLVKAIITVESQFTARAVSPAGARGLMQLMPATAAELGFDPRALGDPDTNIRAGTAYLAVLCATLRRVHGPSGACRGRGATWRIQRVLAAYHSGPAAITGRPWHESTRLYVRDVLAAYKSDRSELRPRPAIAAAGPRKEGA